MLPRPAQLLIATSARVASLHRHGVVPIHDPTVVTISSSSFNLLLFDLACHVKDTACFKLYQTHI